MKVETKLQKELIDSIVKDGGYAKKINGNMAVGIPDLLIAWPGFGLFVAECKRLVGLGDVFDREIGVTEKQSLTMQHFTLPNARKGKGQSACVFVFIEHMKQERLVILPWSSRRLSNAYEDLPCTWVERQPKGYWPIRVLLSNPDVNLVRV